MRQFTGKTIVAVCLGCVLVAGHDSLAQSAGIVFRYLPGQPDLSSSLALTGIEEGPFVDSRELTARGPGGWGLASPFSAEFEAPGSTARSAGLDPVTQPLGPNLTLEAWIRSDFDAQTATLLSNRVSVGDGFTLGLSGGIPYAVLKSGADYRVDGNAVVSAGEDRWIAATVSYSGGDLELTLYMDGRQIGFSSFTPSITGAYHLDVPYFIGTSADGSRAAPVLTGDFTGHVFAAIIRSYVANGLYLNSLLPDDGGLYFGLPAYHDYPSGAFQLPMDLRIVPEPVRVSRRIFLPYANDKFIPQGTASWVEQGESGPVRLVYVSYYHRTRSGVLESQHSIVTEIDSDTGRVRRMFRLMGQLEFAHVGGVARTQDAFFVASQNTLERYLLPVYNGPGSPRYYELSPDASGTVRVQSKASFVSTFRDTLWVGDYRTSSDVKPFLYAHALDVDGRPERSASRVFAIPRKIQGIDFFEYGGETHVFMSRNRSSTEAELLRFRVDRLESVDVVAPDTTISMPFGIEDLSFFPDGMLWTNSESGTDFYQRKAVNPWRPFYPFVYGIDASELFKDITITAVDPVPARKSGIRIESFPNPFRSATTIRITVEISQPVRISVFNVLGRRLAELVDARLQAGVHHFTWNRRNLASGLVFALVEADGFREAYPLILTN